MEPGSWRHPVVSRTCDGASGRSSPRGTDGRSAEEVRREGFTGSAAVGRMARTARSRPARPQPDYRHAAYGWRQERGNAQARPAVPFALGPALTHSRGFGAITARFWRSLPRETLLYGDAAGYAPLREVVAQHVQQARGIDCSAEQVFVVEGSQQGLDLATRLVLDSGDEAWVEDPGYIGARAAIESAGATLVPVPVDDDGLDVAAGRQRAPTAVCLCYSIDQFPLGVTLTAARRLALWEWARGRMLDLRRL